MATFSALPYDITHQILNNLHATDLQSLKTLSVTCRQMRDQAVPILFAAIYFDEEASSYDIEDAVGRILTLLTNPFLLAGVRRFCMRVESGVHESLLMSSLFRLIASMPNLHELSFDAPRKLATRLRMAAFPLATLLKDEEIPKSLVVAYLEAKLFDPSTYQLPSVKKLVLDSWEWCFLADYCPQMQTLEVIRDSNADYINLRGENCFEVDIAHLARTHPNLRCLHLHENASVETVSALAKCLSNLDELGLHRPAVPLTNGLSHFSSFGNLHTLMLPSISDLRRIPRWDENACDLCKERATIIRQEAAIDVINALQTQVASLKEVQFGLHTRREVYQRSADGAFTHVKTLSRRFYHMSKDDVALIDAPPKESTDRKGKGRAREPFWTSSKPDTETHIYASSGAPRPYSPCRHVIRIQDSRSPSPRRYSRTHSPVQIIIPAGRRTRSRSPQIVGSSAAHILTPSPPRRSGFLGRLFGRRRSPNQNRAGAPEPRHEVSPPRRQVSNWRRRSPSPNVITIPTYRTRETPSQPIIVSERRSMDPSPRVITIPTYRTYETPPQPIIVSERRSMDPSLRERSPPWRGRSPSLNRNWWSRSPRGRYMRSRSPRRLVLRRRRPIVERLEDRRWSLSPPVRYRPGHGAFRRPRSRSRSRSRSPIVIAPWTPPSYRSRSPRVIIHQDSFRRRSRSRSPIIIHEGYPRSASRRRYRSRSPIIIHEGYPRSASRRRYRSRSPIIVAGTRRYHSRTPSPRIIRPGRDRSFASRSSSRSRSPPGQYDHRTSPSRGRSLSRSPLGTNT